MTWGVVWPDARGKDAGVKDGRLPGTARAGFAAVDRAGKPRIKT